MKKRIHKIMCDCDYEVKDGCLVEISNANKEYYTCPGCGGMRKIKESQLRLARLNFERWEKERTDRAEDPINHPSCKEGTIVQAMKDYDEINNPPHYKFGEYEVIDIIMAWITDNDVSGTEGFLWASMQQYLFRYRKKKGVQDLKKAEFYLKKLLEKYDGAKKAG